MTEHTPQRSPKAALVPRARELAAVTATTELWCHSAQTMIYDLIEQLEQRTQNVIDCNARSRALAEKVIGLEEQLESYETALREIADSGLAAGEVLRRVARRVLESSPAREPA